MNLSISFRLKDYNAASLARMHITLDLLQI
jgi:hypothetical protein